jgi:copper resistance protein B
MNAMTSPQTKSKLALLGLAIASLLGAAPVVAQEMDHSKMQMPPETATPPAKKPSATKRAAKPVAAKKPATDPHAGHAMPKPATRPQPAPVDHAAMGHGTPAPVEATEPVDHAAMGHGTPAPVEAAEPVDHAAMGHGTPPPEEPAEPVDHAAMGHGAPPPQEPAQPIDHAAMGHDMPMPEQAQPVDHTAMGHGLPPAAPTAPREPIPVLTDADRAAAFTDAGGHEAHDMHDEAIHSFVLFDRLEAWTADEGTGMEWEGQAWIGSDLNRLWLRSEGERVDGHTEAADLEVLYGRSIARWWDLVAGVRHDFKPGASQDFVAIGVMGLAPYKFEVAATVYIGESGQTAARAEIEYETLLTNRLILQPLVEINLYGQNDPRRGIGSGLSTVEAGLRLRYEFTRKFAPYIGVVHERAFGRTADFRRDEGEDTSDTRFVAGLRIWF